MHAKVNNNFQEVTNTIVKGRMVPKHHYKILPHY